MTHEHEISDTLREQRLIERRIHCGGSGLLALRRVQKVFHLAIKHALRKHP